MRYDAILYDMDGTVIDSLEGIADAVNYTLDHFGMPRRDVDTVRALTGNGAGKLLAGAVPPGTPPERLEEVLEFYRPYYAAHAGANTRPFAGILPLMARLWERGVRQAIVSNKPDSAVQPLYRRYFAQVCQLAMGERADLRRKPWPDMVEAAARELGVALDRCLYVGDSEVDGETARNAGLDCALVTWGFRSRGELEKAGGTVLVDTPGELERWLLKG